MTQAWGSACAGDNSQVECVDRSAQKDRGTSCSSAALKVSQGSLSLKALEARYSALRSKPTPSHSVTHCLKDRLCVGCLGISGPRGYCFQLTSCCKLPYM